MSKKITVSFDDKLHEQLSNAAASEDKKRSAWIREQVISALNPKEPDEKELKAVIAEAESVAADLVVEESTVEELPPEEAIDIPEAPVVTPRKQPGVFSRIVGEVSTSLLWLGVGFVCGMLFTTLYK